MESTPWNLIVSMVAIVAIVWLFLHYSRSFGNESPKAKILYISGYAVLIIVELVVYICMNSYQKDDIVGSISFGATLSSLIMSVVAIIFTIVSGKDGKEQLGRITQATSDLQETASTLTSFTAIADHIDDQLELLFGKIQALEQQAANTNAKLDRWTKKDNKLTEHKAAEELPEEILDQFIASVSPLGLLSLIVFALSKENDKEIDFDQFGEMFEKDNRDYVYGFAMACSSMGLAHFKGKWPKLTANYIQKDVLTKAEARWQSLVDSEKGDNKQYITINYNAVRTYFTNKDSESADN